MELTISLSTYLSIYLSVYLSVGVSQRNKMITRLPSERQLEKFNKTSTKSKQMPQQVQKKQYTFKAIVSVIEMKSSLGLLIPSAKDK